MFSDYKTETEYMRVAINQKDILVKTKSLFAKHRSEAGDRDERGSDQIHTGFAVGNLTKGTIGYKVNVSSTTKENTL